MTPSNPLRPGGHRRRLARQRRQRWRRRHVAVVIVAALAVMLAALLGLSAGQTAGPGATAVPLYRLPARLTEPSVAGRKTPVVASPFHASAAPVARPTYGIALAPPDEQVGTRLTFHVRSGILFDVWSGRVLWQHDPGRKLPIASLTKMMTALVVAGRGRPSDQVMITRAAVDYVGSGVGELPLHKQVPLRSLLYGLLLPSGNDAAIALAQHVAGNERHFVELMNAQAGRMGLTCSHFASVSGIVDRGNYSCTSDLAVMAHAVLQQPLLAPIVAARSAIIPFPILGGHLYLYNNNPLLLERYGGTDGVKTGYTRAAGPCLVATARRGHVWLGVVLLGSVDPAAQARKLLDAGFAKLGRH